MIKYVLFLTDTLRSLAKEHFYETVLAVKSFPDPYDDDESENVVKTYSGEQSDANNTSDKQQEFFNSKPMRHNSQDHDVIPCSLDASSEIHSHHSSSREDWEEIVSVLEIFPDMHHDNNGENIMKNDSGDQFYRNETLDGRKQSDNFTAITHDIEDNIEITCNTVLSLEGCQSMETLSSASYEKIFVDASSRDRPGTKSSFTAAKPPILGRRSSSIPEDKADTTAVPMTRNFQDKFPENVVGGPTKQSYQPLDVIEEDDSLEINESTSNLSENEASETDHHVTYPSKTLPPGISLKSHSTDSELFEIMKGKLEYRVHDVAGASEAEETSETDSWCSSKLFPQESNFNSHDKATAGNSVDNVNCRINPKSGGMTNTHLSLGSLMSDLSEADTVKENKDYRKDKTPNSRCTSALDIHEETELQPVEDSNTTWQVSHYRCFSRQTGSVSSSHSCFDEDEISDLDEDLFKRTSVEQIKQRLFRKKVEEHVKRYNSDIETSATDVHSNCGTSEEERLSRPELPDTEIDFFDEEANDLKSQHYLARQFSTEKYAKEYFMKCPECGCDLESESSAGSLLGSSRQFDTCKDGAANEEQTSSVSLSGSFEL